MSEKDMRSFFVDTTPDSRQAARQAAPQAAQGNDARLLDKVHQAFMFADHTFCDLDKGQLKRAFSEAQALAKSGLFGDEISPDVSVDPYGEFTFSHRSAAGYVDIGVRGEHELSYHIRNDIDPKQTVFDDVHWKDRDIPKPLFCALETLRKHLLSQDR